MMLRMVAPSSEPFEYANPEVTGTSRIEFIDDCEATLVVSYGVSGIPAGWFDDEYRLVAGLEGFDIDFPGPYYYAGGATFETGGIGPTSVEPVSSANVDTVIVGGQQVLHTDNVKPPNLLHQWKWVLFR